MLPIFVENNFTLLEQQLNFNFENIFGLNKIKIKNIIIHVSLI